MYGIVCHSCKPHRSGLSIAGRHLDQVHGGATIGLNNRMEAPDFIERSSYVWVLHVPAMWTITCTACSSTITRAASQ
jgi:hypothetical protein